MKIAYLLLSFGWSALLICSGSALEENDGVPSAAVENLPLTTTPALSEEKGGDRYASKCSVMYRCHLCLEETSLTKAIYVSIATSQTTYVLVWKRSA